MTPGRFILRAELAAPARKDLVTYGYELTPSSIFVVSDWRLPAGEAVRLRLSFPRVLAPVDLVARVAATTDAGAPGELAGMRLEFDQPVPELVDLLAKLATGELATAAPYKVLLVEDNRLIRDVFAHGFATFFRRTGEFVVEHAASAEAAWQQLVAARDAGAPFDLAIVDHMLPAENGAQLIARVRGADDPRIGHLPIVAISVGGRDARDATIAAGADLFIDKPLVFKDLFSTLRILWARRDEGRRSILVLDDSELALELARSILEDAGFTVDVAADLATFDAKRTARDPDLILVDVQMPEAYGDDIVAMLRGVHGVTIPIVLLSSLDERELARRAADAEAAGWVSKNAGAAALVQKCRELLSAEAA